MINQKTSSPSSSIRSPQYDGLLTKDEIQQLSSAPCPSPVVQRAALFSYYTGLRYDVIRELRNENIVSIQGTTRLSYRHPVYGLFDIPLSAMTLACCDPMRHSSDLLFADLPDVTWLSPILAKWAKAAGIRHRLTFYSFRRSHTMQNYNSAT